MPRVYRKRLSDEVVLSGDHQDISRACEALGNHERTLLGELQPCRTPGAGDATATASPNTIQSYHARADLQKVITPTMGS